MSDKRISKSDKKAIKSARREIRNSPEPVASQRQLATIQYGSKR